MGKKFKYGTTSLIEILLIAGILILINIYSVGEFRRVDLTQNREYTISNATKKILSELDDIVNIKVFISNELPPQFLNIKRQIVDLMQEFQAYAPAANFKVRYIDPEENPRYKQEAEIAGIPQVSVRVMEKDQMVVKQAYLGILIEHENKTESIPVAARVENLEYELMSRIKKVLQKESDIPSIGILQGHGEPSTRPGNPQRNEQPGELAYFVEALRKQYKAFDVELERQTEVPSTVKTLLVVNPGSIPDYQLYAIDQFLMGGGKLVCFISGMEAYDNLNEPPKTFTSGINDLLVSYGVKINNDFVLDQSCESVTFRTGPVSFMQKPYPFWVRVIKENFNQDHPITSTLESMVFQWPSSISILKDKTERVEVVELAKSSKKSWLMTKDYNTSPMQDFNVLPTGDQFTLAVELKGIFTSHFEGKEKPVNPNDGKQLGQPGVFKAHSAPATLIVVSTDMPLHNPNWNPEAQQPSVDEIQNFVLNMFDYLNIGDELIGIRSRQATNRPLKAELIEKDSQKAMIRFVNIFAVPFIVVLIGIVRGILKRGRKVRFEREFKAREAI